MKHLELFAGIGGFRRAMDLLNTDYNLGFESIGFSEIDTNATKTYAANYRPSKTEVVLGDIVTFTQERTNIERLPDFDLLTGGFPCQTFSLMGKQEGFNEERGQMFFRIIDILRIKLPRFIILENVKNLYTHDNKRTYQRIKSELEALKYNVVSDIFNTSDFLLPQKRNRVIIFATQDKIPNNFNFTAEAVKSIFKNISQTTSLIKAESTVDILEEHVPQKYFLSDRIKPTILSDGSANFKSKSEINQDIARPLTASMHKMHRACQDNYYSQKFISSRGMINDSEGISKDEQVKLAIRRLTPAEAFMLQGFPKSFVSNAQQVGLCDGALYKQAGNAVSVNVIYAILYYIFIFNADLWKK